MEAGAKYAEDYNDDGEVTASGSHLYVGCWSDFTIPAGVKNVTVTAKIFISAWDAHTYAYFTDAFFYGKEIVTIGPTTGGTSYINTGYGCKNQSYSGGIMEQFQVEPANHLHGDFLAFANLKIVQASRCHAGKTLARQRGQTALHDARKITEAETAQMRVSTHFLKSP